MLEKQSAEPAQAYVEFQELKTSPTRTQTDPRLADALVKRAKSATLTDGGQETSALLEAALQADPHHHEARILRERLHKMCVPRWHYPMLADTVRNQAYAAAIQAKVSPGDVVLDIGCGAGLTAMLAARAGAKHVYTCEQQPLIAEAARQVIADNGLSDRITVISKWSHDIVVGVDMPELADVVISEIVDTVLLGEGALATLTHAMAALAKPDARAIPERGILLAQVMESSDLMTQWRPDVAEGFDLSAFHRFSNIAQLTPNDLSAHEMRPLGPMKAIFAFDFRRPSIDAARNTLALECTSPGMAHAVFLSFEMELAPKISVDNAMETQGHWGRTAFLLEHPVAVATGDHLDVTAQHDAAELSVSIHPPRASVVSDPASDLAGGTAVWVSPNWNTTGPRPNAPPSLPEQRHHQATPPVQGPDPMPSYH